MFRPKCSFFLGLFHNKDKRSGTDLRGYDRGNPNNIGQLMNLSQSGGTIGTRLGAGILTEQFIGPTLARGCSSWELPAYRPLNMPSLPYAPSGHGEVQHRLLHTFSPSHGQLHNGATLTGTAGSAAAASNGLGRGSFGLVPASLRMASTQPQRTRPAYLANQYPDVFGPLETASPLGHPVGPQSPAANVRPGQNQEDEPNTYSFNPYEPEYNTRFRY
jgi:hypothetical protein